MFVAGLHRDGGYPNLRKQMGVAKRYLVRVWITDRNETIVRSCYRYINATVSCIFSKIGKR